MAVRSAKTTGTKTRKCTTTRNSTISCRTLKLMRSPSGGPSGSAKTNTPFRSWRRRWRSWCGLEGLSEWEATDNCKGWGITGDVDAGKRRDDAAGDAALRDTLRIEDRGTTRRARID